MASSASWLPSASYAQQRQIAPPASPTSTSPPTEWKSRRPEATHLPNALWVHASVLSGGLPEGDAGFAELESLGIRTVISVDGITPDVESATQHGLRYVHLPHGYDGIPAAKLNEIAKALRDLPKPIYVHCHHGRHRSPAAAAAACIALGWLPQQAGTEVLKEAGTDPGFRGLFAAVEDAVAIEPEVLNRLEVNWVSVAPRPAMVETMVAMESVLDQLTHSLSRSKTPTVGSELAQALLLKEYYNELHRSSRAENREAEFCKLLEQGLAITERLESQIKVPKSNRDFSVQEMAEFDAMVLEVRKNCRDCHRQFRDNASDR